MKFGKLDIEPAKNPAILDTGTWDPEGVRKAIGRLEPTYWERLLDAIKQQNPLPSAAEFTPHATSCTRGGGSTVFVSSLADGQDVFVQCSTHDPGASEALLGPPLHAETLGNAAHITVYGTDAAIVDRFFRVLSPDFGPAAMGAVPRLGIGTRMTTAMWPGIFQAMGACGFEANAIQNSVRELNLLESLLAGRPAAKNYAFNLGTIESGYTGSSFEGLWVAGALAGLKDSNQPQYGADADHIQVKRGDEGLSRARDLATAAQYYTFFTLDMADILDYGALQTQSAATARGYLAAKIPDSDERESVLLHHRKKRAIGGRSYQLDEETVGRLVGKYWDALHALQVLSDHIRELKDGRPVDLELSIDEHPSDVETFECVTNDSELLFVLSEIRRRDIPLTHVAPNVGIEKETDYRCPDGLEGLASRIRSLKPIADALEVMLDFHSGDDLGPETRRVIQRATGGKLHFKISPSLQLLFADVLKDFHPDLFARWWDDAMAYARHEANAGSPTAARCVRETEATVAERGYPSPRDSAFHHYSFAFVGRRDEDGQFVNRQEFYDLSPAFYREHHTRLAQHLCALAEELL